MAKLSPAERLERVRADLQAVEEARNRTGWFYQLRRKFNRVVDWCADQYTSAEYYLHVHFPNSYVVLFSTISVLASAIYVFDIVTDVLVAKVLWQEGFRTEAAVVLVLVLSHYLLIAVLLAARLHYLLEEWVLAAIDRLGRPAGAVDNVEGGVADAPTGSTGVFLSFEQDQPLSQRLLGQAGGAVRVVLKLCTLLVYGLALLVAVPVLDVCMLWVELAAGVMRGRGSGGSQRVERANTFQNFLLQYQTVRVPSECLLESLPQTAYQGFLFVRQRNNPLFQISTRTLVQSIVVSFVNLVKNLVDIYIAWKVSGFSLMSYAANALQFEGAAQLPFRWNSLRSTLAARLVLAGDFVGLAHAQKMKLFQAALQRKHIHITTHEAAALHSECVVVVSSWSLLGFISGMLPVSLSSEEESEAALMLDLRDINKLPLRDDTRTVAPARAQRLRSAVRESLLEFLNASPLWRNLVRVRLAECRLAGDDMYALVELLLREVVQELDLAGNPLGDVGVAVLTEGLMGNASLCKLVLARTRITHAGAYHLKQGLTDHERLTSFDVSFNHLGSEGLQHLASLMPSLPQLTALNVAHCRTGAAGLAAVCAEAATSTCGLEVLELSRNPGLANISAMDYLVSVMQRSRKLQKLAVGGCGLRPTALASLWAALAQNAHLRVLDLSHTPLGAGDVVGLCAALTARTALEARPLLDRTSAAAASRQGAGGEGAGSTSLRPGAAAAQLSARGSLHPMREEVGSGTEEGASVAHKGLKEGPMATPPEEKERTSDGAVPGRGQGLRGSGQLGEVGAAETVEPRVRLSKHTSMPASRHRGGRIVGNTFVTAATLRTHTSFRLAAGSLPAGVSTEGMDLVREGDTEGQGDGGSAGFTSSYLTRRKLGTRRREQPQAQRPSAYLEDLCVAGCGLEAADLDAVVDALRQAPGLEVLDISDNRGLGNECLDALAQLLQQQRATLAVLKAMRCGLSAWGVSRPGVALALSLLVQLDLSGNALGDEGVMRLSAYMLDGRGAPTIQVLVLSATNIGSLSIDALLNSLLSNTSLITLDLSANFIGAFNPAKYARFQATNRSLRLLDLRANQLSKPWCTELQVASAAGMRRVVLF